MNFTILGKEIDSKLKKTYAADAVKANINLHNEKGEGNDYTGWLKYPVDYDRQEFSYVFSEAEKIRKQFDAVIVIGIGGSYLGCRAVLEAVKGSMYYETPEENPKIYFAGNNISSEYMNKLLKVLDNKDICINVISKSGSTTETSIAFRVIYERMAVKYSEQELKERIYVTTGGKGSILREMAQKEGYAAFSIPENIGGRYSVFTPVGIFPLACAGIDVKRMIEGAAEGYYEYMQNDAENNIAVKYGALRHYYYMQGKKIEILAVNEPSLVFLAEWWKQLFGESCGKDGKGIFPAAVNYSADLHSMGQYIQDGERIIFETLLTGSPYAEKITIPYNQNNYGNINFMQGKTLEEINDIVVSAVSEAHQKGNVPVAVVDIGEINEFNIGKLMYFFMKSCAVSGYLSNINPFNQPGVEEYKKNMFRLLNKPEF